MWVISGAVPGRGILDCNANAARWHRGPSQPRRRPRRCDTTRPPPRRAAPWPTPSTECPARATGGAASGRKKRRRGYSPRWTSSPAAAPAGGQAAEHESKPSPTHLQRRCFSMFQLGEGQLPCARLVMPAGGPGRWRRANQGYPNVAEQLLATCPGKFTPDDPGEL